MTILGENTMFLVLLAVAKSFNLSCNTIHRYMHLRTISFHQGETFM